MRAGTCVYGTINRRRQFLMSAVSTSPFGRTSASSGFESWFGPSPGTPGVPKRHRILREATSIKVTTEYSSSVAMICFPFGVKKASSGLLNETPGGRSPACGHVQRVRPWGSTTIKRLLPSSAIKTGPGSTLGSDPGARCAVPVPGPGNREGVVVDLPWAAVLGATVRPGPPHELIATPRVIRMAVTIEPATVRWRRTLLETR